jgi:hypothetical protein
MHHNLALSQSADPEIQTNKQQNPLTGSLTQWSMVYLAGTVLVNGFLQIT